MCCLFGMIDYGHSFTGKVKAQIVHALAAAGEARGIDATGIAYNSGSKLHVYKRPVPGRELLIRIPDDASVIMGHARMTTQGNGIYMASASISRRLFNLLADANALAWPMVLPAQIECCE